MIAKPLKKTEILKGFIHIPANSRQELIGDAHLPYDTRLNGSPARLDKQGRLWSSCLRNRYPIGTEVAISKVGQDYEIRPSHPKVEFSALGTEETEQNARKNETEYRKETWCKVIEGDCLRHIDISIIGKVHLTFFDPPYNQGKSYRFFDDNQLDEEYWKWVNEVLEKVYDVTELGGAVYFMQREKNAEMVLCSLRKTGWTFQNLVIWKKKTSAVPCQSRFSKQYQIIAYAIKGESPRVFNRLRIDPPPLPEHRYQHENGVYVTDVWDDVRELTSGYFAGDEAIRDDQGKRVHTQQSPISLLLRIILSSSLPGDVVLDPVAGTGTTLTVAKQLQRNSIGIEIDPHYVALIRVRLALLRPADRIPKRYYDYYRFTPKFKELWQFKSTMNEQERNP
jgi:DNA modification methylase